MDNEKYITIKELAELKGVSTRAIRLSKEKYITREITVKGGKSFEILLSSIESELQEKYYSKIEDVRAKLANRQGNSEVRRNRLLKEIGHDEEKRNLITSLKEEIKA